MNHFNISFSLLVLSAEENDQIKISNLLDEILYTTDKKTPSTKCLENLHSIYTKLEVPYQKQQVSSFWVMMVLLVMCLVLVFLLPLYTRLSY